MSEIDEDIISRVRRIDVSIRQRGDDTWSRDLDGLPGGCGLPSEADVAQDAFDAIGVAMVGRNIIVGRLKAEGGHDGAFISRGIAEVTHRLRPRAPGGDDDQQ